MKAAFALLPNTEVSNYVKKLAWESFLKYHTSISVCRLPAHISLKQPFTIPDLQMLESYMSELASSISPFEIKLTELQLIPINIGEVESGILWVDVQESHVLRLLHQRVNAELDQLFTNTHADFDGADYHFHMTVMIGGQPIEVYQQLYDELPNRRVNLTCLATELAMFVYDEPITLDSAYMTYKILPISR